ncbi:hypothetical protein [Actinocorallia libanotica]|uniref:Uncharacterized protein n=1 Tax=Actinocorallia libanotica TaxID=46162 RepID=A0ABN1Q1K8_9ACTN
MQVRCARCGAVAARVEVYGPGETPRGGEAALGPGKWWLVFEGVVGCNGRGDLIDEARARRISRAFTPPLSYRQVHEAGFHDDAGFCAECDAGYCHGCWNPSTSGFGRCPNGHGKSLDPHGWRD